MPTNPRSNLELANRRRSQRARFKREILYQPSMLEAALVRRPEFLHGAKVHELVRSLRYIGHRRATEILRAAGVDERARVRDLSRRQTALVIRELRYRQAA